MARIFLGLMFLAVTAVGLRDARAQEAALVWVQIEAKPSLNEAQVAARQYDATLSDVNGFSLGQGWYAIALGPYRQEEAERVLQVYRREGVIAPDSYIATTSDYEQQFWPVGRNILAEVATDAAPDDIALDPAIEPEPVEVEPEPVQETPQQARMSERTLDRAAREALQIALKWAGYYTGRIDAAFGQGTRGAMAGWQRDNGHSVTGILTTRQRAELLRQYNAVLDGLGVETVTDAETGIAVEIPTQVVEFSRYEPPFAHFDATGDLPARVLLISQTGDRRTMGGLYDIMQTLDIVPETGDRSLESDRFTLIGEGEQRISHTQVWLRDGEIKGFTLIWPTGDEARRTRLLERMLTSFERLPGTLDPAMGTNAEQSIDLISGLRIRKPRLSRSGFYVDASGTVLTTADAVAQCGRITIDETYEARVALVDDSIGVAVLRPETRLSPPQVATFQQRIPRLQSDIAVAGYSYGGVLGAPTMTFGQVSDLKGLHGETHLKRLALSALEGDAGGPVLDRGGAVLGMLLPHAVEGRKLPSGVSFAATNGALQGVLSRGGVSPRNTNDIAPLSAEALTNRASAMTVLVSCWE